MLTRNKAREQKLRLGTGLNGGNAGKRAAENSPAVQPQKKRSALGDITNDLRNVRIDSTKKGAIIPGDDSTLRKNSSLESRTEDESLATQGANSSAPADVSMLSTVDETDEESITSASDKSETAHDQGGLTVFLPSFGIRTEYDRENELDPYHIPHYAEDIFEYYKARERAFIVGNYMDRQPPSGGITRQMRAILIDWMVEIQEDFELNHETLYQAVKMIDLYLDRITVSKETLQLVGTTALLISSKFDERQPPLIDDFLYICDDAYNRKQLLDMEIFMLKILKFDVGFPLSYRFLRRFAKTTKTTMETLTLARYILETSLMHYEFVQVRDSFVAAAALLLALRMKDSTNWTELHQKYSGYNLEELEPLMWKLNKAIKGTPLMKNLSNVRSKYSHEVFFGVANLRPLQEPKSP